MPLTGQLFFRINQSNDVQLGAIDNTGASATPTSIYFGGGFRAGTPQNIGVHNGNETSIAIDTAAGLVFSIGIGNNGSYDAVSVHNLNTGALIETIEFGPNTGSAATDDIVQALALDPFTNTLYVGDWGTDTATTGVAKFTYDPATGLLTPSTTGNSSTTITTTTPTGGGGFNSTTSTASGIYLFTSSQLSTPSAYTNANAFFLDSANNKLYYVNDDSGYNTAPYTSVNGVYVVNTVGPTFTATQLTSNGSGTGQFPVATGGPGSIGLHGNLLGLAVDVADNTVFFLSTDTEGSSNIALWWVNTTGAGQTATKITLPAGVQLDFAGQTNEGGDAAGLTFDPTTNQLYLTDADNDVTTRDTGHIYQLQYTPATHSVTLINDYDAAQLVGATPATVDSLTAPSTTFFDILPTLSTSGTSTHAAEQGANLALLSATPSVTDVDGNHLASATVQITSGTFSSNENSTSDDHLTIASAQRTGTDASGTISGTSISYSYNSATETLTLTGYDTLADYKTALSFVQYFTTGDNPTNYGGSTSRTITWQVNDGAVGNPSGANATTSTLNIDAVNDAPVAAGAGNTVGYTEQAAALAVDSGLTVNDADNLNLTGATATISSGLQSGDTLHFTNQNGISLVSFAAGVLTLSGSATLAEYQTALRSVTFDNTSNDNPTNGGTATTRTITWVLNDGSGANNLSTGVTTTINITAVDDPAAAKADAVSVAENGTLSGNAFANNGSGVDSDPDGPAFSITQVNGSAFTVGNQITLASGAHLTITNTATGTFSYDPNHVFDFLPPAGSGASNLTATDNFTYTITGGSTATVTVTVSGVDSNDTLIGTAGADTFAGGTGNDSYLVNNVADTVTENGNEGLDKVVSTVSYTIPNNVEALYLKGTGLTGTGSAGDDILLSAASGGANTLVGLGGNDLYYVNHAGDVVTEAANGGHDIVLSSVDYTLPANVEALYMAGSGLTGTGTAGSDILLSAGGPNTLVGLGGDDVYYVQNSGDLVTEAGGGGNDLVVALVDFTMPANVEAMFVLGSGITGTGSAGDDTLLSNGGPNTLIGLGGNDSYYAGNAADVITEAANGGFDSVTATVSYTLPTNVEVMYLNGTGLTGTGTSNADTMVTQGANTLVGGGGDDAFVFFSGSANGAAVSDFDGAGEQDHLVFSGFGTAAQGATFTQIGVTDQWQIHSGLDAHNETITFSNHTILQQTDFVFV